MYVVENEGAGETDMGFWFDAIVSHKDISLCANFLYLTFFVPSILSSYML